MAQSFIEHTSFVRVRYADTDKMGIVYYGKYFEYFEVARTEMLRACGLPYSEIESAGYGLPVLEASARYFRGAQYDELLRIETRMEVSVSPRLNIQYQVFLENASEIMVDGKTTLGFVRMETGKPSRPPAIYSEAIQQFLERNNSAAHA